MSKLKERLLIAGRWILPGLTDKREIAVCRSCNNQVIFDDHLVSRGYLGYCPWHDEDLHADQMFFYDFASYNKSIKFFAAPLDFRDRWAILVMRLRKG